MELLEGARNKNKSEQNKKKKVKNKFSERRKV